MTIKMIDEFKLPVKKVPGGVMPYLKDCNDLVIFVGDEAHVKAAVLAINAYDANQQEISALKMENAQLKGENASMAAYADQRIRMLTRVNNKLREDKS